MPILISIIDDKQLNRETVKSKIASYAGEIELLFEARNGRDFLEKMKIADRHPQVVLVDLEMPEMDGIETIRFASEIYSSIKFIVLTVFEDNNKIFDAIKVGASGYLLKEDTAVNIVDAITNVVEYNGIPMSPSVARKTIELLRQTGDPESPQKQEKDYTLSQREMEILVELVSGKNYKAIGEKLFISPLTVRKHVSNIYEKLHVNSRAQIINLAHRKKWI